MSIIRVPQEVPSINEAIELAKKGDTIKVSSGIYAGCVVVNKENLKIVGVGCKKPVIVSDLCCNESGFLIEAKAVEISNFDIIGIFQNGITINKSYCVVQNCHISNSINSGIFIEDGVTSTLIQVVVSSLNGCDGICCAGNNTCIIGCTLKENKNNGITISGINNLVLKCKITLNANDGVHICCNYLPECTMNLILESKICSNGRNGVSSSLNSNFILENCIGKNGCDGIDISDTSENTIIQNKIDCNKGNGVTICDGDNNRVVANKFTCNRRNGVAIGEDGENNSIDDNVFDSNNKAGVLLEPMSSDNSVRDNFFDCNDPNISATPPANTDNFFSGNVKVDNCCC